MAESKIQNFNHLKIHSQFSICEGAVKIDNLRDYLKENNAKSIALCDTSNLCGALEFADKISKIGTQPIIGTQINFRYGETTGLLPLYALNEVGYKRIIELSSLSYLENDELSDPHLDVKELFKKNNGVCLFSGTINGLFGQLFDKGKFNDIRELYIIFSLISISFNLPSTVVNLLPARVIIKLSFFINIARCLPNFFPSGP